MKTIKQIADSLGVDKQRVYRYIRKNHISESLQEAGAMWYDEAAETSIIQHFSEDDYISKLHHDAHHAISSDTVIDAVVSMLQSELETKNEQIRELNTRLAESNAALVAAQQTAQAAQALHAGTIQQNLIPESSSDADVTNGQPSPKRRGLLGWIDSMKRQQQ